MREVLLHSNWQLKQWTPDDDREGGSEAGWIAAPVPGLVHQALLDSGQHGEPGCVRNHAALAPTFAHDYLYRCRFDLPDEVEAGTPARLCFDGLDTIATVWLNGQEILRSDNMFVPHEVEVSRLLRRRDNLLRIRFESALRVGQARQAAGGQRPVWNGDPSRVYVRKAQYHYGWDFGPTLLSAGPWRPVRLQLGAARLLDVHAPVEVAADLATATITVSAHAATDAPAGADQAHGPAYWPDYWIELQLVDPRGQVHTQSRHPLPPSGVVVNPLQVSAPQLWWPRGYGEQPLYTLRTTLGCGEQVLDTRTLRLGLRRLRLRQEPLAGGNESFCFEINNQDIFCGGANWIPADLMPTRVTAAHYRALLQEAAAGEMTMLRVWGGGIYEQDVFYDLCDELGLLVFQDFMFACGMYPSDDDFAQSVAAEAAAAVRRLRHHPSLVLWAGNNEDYSIARSTDSYDGPQTAIPPAADPRAADYRARFDGRRIYEQVLPAAVAAHDHGPSGASRPYWPGSPYSRYHGDPNAQPDGDRHIWEVWHSPLRPYQDYPQLAGRFVSEFGMQAVPSRPTVARGLGEAVDAPALTVENLARLNHGQDGPGRIGHYLAQNLPPARSFDEYVYLTQVLQAETLAYAIRGFRRGFGAPLARSTSGALVWQLADCWPGISWAMIEHLCGETSGPRKASFYAVRRELLPLALGLAHADGGSAPASAPAVDVWAAQSGGQARSAQLVVRGFGLDGALLFRRERAVELGANRVSELGTEALPPASGPVVVGAQLWAGETLLARAVLWPQPLRDLPLQDPAIHLERLRAVGDSAGTQTLRLRARRPAKAVLLGAPGERFDDNLLDLLPDEEVTVHEHVAGAALPPITSLYSVRS